MMTQLARVTIHRAVMDILALNSVAKLTIHHSVPRQSGSGIRGHLPDDSTVQTDCYQPMTSMLSIKKLVAGLQPRTIRMRLRLALLLWVKNEENVEKKNEKNYNARN